MRAVYQKSIDILRKTEKLALQYSEKGFYLAFSGGKDSQCLYHIAKLAGVKFEAHYARTGIDHPELVHFIMRNYPDVIWDRPEMTFWDLVIKRRMLPTIQFRYCCEVLKESRGGQTVTLTGVRRAESAMYDKALKENNYLRYKAERYRRIAEVPTSTFIAQQRIIAEQSRVIADLRKELAKLKKLTKC